MLKVSAKPIDLSDLTILTSVKIDSADRMRNWHLLLQYFDTFCLNWEVVVVEQGEVSQIPCSDRSLPAHVVHRFIESTDAHYKTRNLNLAASLSARKYLMMCDVDVMLPPAAIELGLQKLRAGAKFVCPYNGIMVEIKKKMISDRLDLKSLINELPFFEKGYDRQSLIYERSGLTPIYGDSRYPSTGGALMYERRCFFGAGGWNPNMISYGFQDLEMHLRIKRLGYKLETLDDFNSYHFEHIRLIDSVYNNFYRTNEQEYERVAAMTTTDLRSYVDNGFRCVRLDPAKEIEYKNDAREYALRVSDSDRYALFDLSIVFVVKDFSRQRAESLTDLCNMLEKSFRNYDLVIVEIGLRKYRFLNKVKHYRYDWLNNSHSIADGVELAMSKVNRGFVWLKTFERPIQTEEVQAKLSQLLDGTNLESVFTRASTFGKLQCEKSWPDCSGNILKQSANPIDLADLSIVTSVKIDSADRMRNWHLLLQYFNTFCINWEVVVVEQGEVSQIPCPDWVRPSQIVHRFIESKDAHYKTRNLNLAACLSARKYLMMCDVDVMLPPAALALGLQKLRTGAEFVCPYNGIMVQIKKGMLSDRLDFESLVERLPFFEFDYNRQSLIFEKSGCTPLYGDRYESTGGALMYERLSFFNAGGWNTNMISYGFEDTEMLFRIKRLGYKLEKLDNFNAYHFEHVRNIDSVFNNFYTTHQQEHEKVAAMPRPILRSYVDNGFRSIQMDLTKEIEFKNDSREYAFRISDSDRYDLGDLSIVFVVRDFSRMRAESLAQLCNLLEKNFRNYDLLIVEIALRKYKYLRNIKHFRYEWLNNSHSISDGVEFSMTKVNRAFVSLRTFEQPIQTDDVQEKLLELLDETDMGSVFARVLTGEKQAANKGRGN